MKWLPIETAPKARYPMIVVRGTLRSGYITDPWCVWRDGEKWVRWPHREPPTEWTPLPTPPGSEHAQAKAIMDEMTDEDRLSLMQEWLSLMQEYCVHCGTKHKPCYCTRDD